MKIYILTSLMLLSWTLNSQNSVRKWNEGSIKPYKEKPSYWQYQGKPILLLGGTDNDNIFQMTHYISHLDSLKEIGGNYMRCTMSDRDPGDHRAFYRDSNGKYDLNRWNPVYWDQFRGLLRAAKERDMIVQIEVWDRFDHSRDEWLSDPYHPANNINYSYDEAGLDSIYPNHPGSNEQPFFYTVPELQNNQSLLHYQKHFVDQLLSISLEFGNVLYCIDNETKGDPAWAEYWAQYLRQKAGNKNILITEMWDDWDVTSSQHLATINHPEIYDFIDLSQNSQTTGHDNWLHPQHVFDHIRKNPRPVNNVKIYGNDLKPGYVRQGKNSDHAVQLFFKNILGGFASSRFHRPTTGLGLSTRSINAIATIRKIEKKLKFWDIEPHMELLRNVEEGIAYLSAQPGESYVLYFPGKGEVNLDLSQTEGSFIGDWIHSTNAQWKERVEIQGGKLVKITPPGSDGWLLVIRR